MKKAIILFFAFSFVFVTCKKKDTTQAAYSPTCTGTKSYANDVKPLIQSYCVSCHSSYGTYSGAKASASSIRSSIVGGTMPKGTTLSDAQKNNIVCWIDAGMPNN
jgi:uncharacterized membrane protein